METNSLEPNQAPDFPESDRRRSERPLLRIPLMVEGSDAEGNAFKERTCTILINLTGARISLKNSVRPGDEITITNLLMQQSAAVKVIGRPETHIGTGVEWGVEFVGAAEEFWGVIFPEKKEDPPTENIIDALLECPECHVRELAKLVMEDYRELTTQGSLKRDCPKCRAERGWVLGIVDVALQDANAKSLDPVYTTQAIGLETQRRTVNRYAVLLPVRTRHWDGGEEVTRTENLSPMGMCFTSNLAMKQGDSVFLTVGDLPEDQQVEVPARIAWCRPLGGGKSFYGVRLADAE